VHDVPPTRTKAPLAPKFVPVIVTVTFWPRAQLIVFEPEGVHPVIEVNVGAAKDKKG